MNQYCTSAASSAPQILCRGLVNPVLVRAALQTASNNCIDGLLKLPALIACVGGKSRRHRGSFWSARSPGAMQSATMSYDMRAARLAAHWTTRAHMLTAASMRSLCQ